MVQIDQFHILDIRTELINAQKTISAWTVQYYWLIFVHFIDLCKGFDLFSYHIFHT